MSMSRKKCCVPGCLESGGSHGTMHLFPNPVKDRARFNQWVFVIGGDIIGLDNEDIYKHRSVCHAHFEEKFCCRKNKISNIAVPTLHMPGPLSLPKFTSVERRPLRQTQNYPDSPSSTLATPSDSIDAPKPSMPVNLVIPSTFEHAADVIIEEGCSLSSSPEPESASPCARDEEVSDNLVLNSRLSQASQRVLLSTELALVDANLPEPESYNAPDFATTSECSQPEDDQLEETILKLVGVAQPDMALGKNINDDIASRWQDILVKGLTQEAKQSMLRKYKIPGNCSFLVAPTLNPEAKAAVPDILLKRDAALMQKQNQIGIALAALSQVADMILRRETSRQALLQPLSDACRILCDSHNIETKTRRSIVMSSTDTSLRDALANTDRDQYLFGEDLAERLQVPTSVTSIGKSSVETSLVSIPSKSVHKHTTKSCNLKFKKINHSKLPNRVIKLRRVRVCGAPRPAAGTSGGEHANKLIY